jgi:hypothetical protein
VTSPRDPIPRRPADAVTLPWPTIEGRADAKYLRVGDRVALRHLARRDWSMMATVTRVEGLAFGRGKSIEVRPDEPITSPANWEAV